MFVGIGDAALAPPPTNGGIMNDPSLPRGIRNNNPLNIIYTPANNWVGQVGNDGTFAQFDSPVDGLRVAYIIFQKHYDAGAQTLTSFIQQWSATDQATYIATVSGILGIDPNVTFDLGSIAIPLARAMCGVENGLAYLDYYPQDTYQQAYQLATS